MTVGPFVRKERTLLILALAALAATLVLLVLLITLRSTEQASALGEPRFWPEQLSDQLEMPSSMAWLPDSTMLIAQRNGKVRIFKDGTLAPGPLRGVPKAFPGFYEGIKDIVLDPDYASNRTIYLYLLEGTAEGRYAAVYKGRYDHGGLSDVVRIFRTKEMVGGTWVFATRLLFTKDKYLLIAVAEDHKIHGQDLDSHIGKILRINRDGSVPPDNPFVGRSGALPEIWSYGHRTPLGLYQDLQSGEILETESGPRGGDEINRIKKGANYGWPLASWGFAYANGGLETPLQTAPGVVEPLTVWTPSVTPAGLTRNLGSVYTGWKGDYFVGELSGQALERIRFAKGQVVLKERLLHDLGERFRDVKMGPDDHIYLLTDSGRLLRLQPGEPTDDQARLSARKNERPLIAGLESAELEAMRHGDPAKGKRAFVNRCSACHTIGSAVSGGGIGPDLENVFNSLAGRKPSYPYSSDLAGAPRRWTYTSLNMFIADPRKMFPTTTMAAPPVTDPVERSDIVAFLRAHAKDQNYAQ